MKKYIQQTDLEQLLKRLTIYRSNYNTYSNGEWRKSDHYLTDQNLLRNFQLKTPKVSWFTCHMTNFFAIDIDNHDGKTNIIQQYNIIIKQFGQPSFVNKSPRGLHVYYCFKEKFSIDLIKHEVKSLLPFDVEVKPTAYESLRVFSKETLLNPCTLKKFRSDKKFSSILNESPIYNLYELFPDSTFRKTFQRKSSASQYDIIFKGETNDAINYLAPIFKSNGLSEDDAVKEFMSRLSPDYNGPCKSEHHVYKRIHSFYKNDYESKFVKLNSESIYENHKHIFDTIISKAIKENSDLSDYNLTKHIHSLKLVLSEIYKNIERIQLIKENPTLMANYSSMYPFFRFETSKGNFPLPIKQLQASCPGYKKALNFLFKIGFLIKPNGQRYCTGSCIYYSIDEQFNLPKFDKVLIDLKLVCSVKEIINKLFFHKPTVISNICYNMFNHQKVEEQVSHTKAHLKFSG